MRACAACPACGRDGVAGQGCRLALHAGLATSRPLVPPRLPAQALDEARTALEAEQAKSMRLEVELAEAQQKLSRMEELERELQKYRCGAGAVQPPQYTAPTALTLWGRCWG